MLTHNKAFDSALHAAHDTQCNKAMAQFIFPLLDLTRLEDDKDDKAVAALCQEAEGVAAVCVYSRFIPTAKKILNHSSVKIATVCNFPSGSESLQKVIAEINTAKELGAHEIDLVFPYEAFLEGKLDFVANFLNHSRDACGTHTLKVILETGALPDIDNIIQASEMALECGADFLKTSTGKIPVGATLEAAAAMLFTIKKQNPKAGFKASGGVKTVAAASQYIALAQHIMGENWITPETFRFGASSLLKDIQNLCE